MRCRAHAADMAERAPGASGSDDVTTRSVVAVVDDDESVRESLPDLLEDLGYAARTFASGEELLASDSPTLACCFLLDVAMPRMSGPELQQALRSRGVAAPVVFITAPADPVLRQRLLAAGALECLFKPFTDRQLREVLDAALQSR